LLSVRAAVRVRALRDDRGLGNVKRISFSIQNKQHSKQTAFNTSFEVEMTDLQGVTISPIERSSEYFR
jgi:hypothetical protein